MIYVKEAKANKLAGNTAIFISFPYNSDAPTIINIIKAGGTYVYNPKTKTWEVPITLLAYILDNLTYFADIMLTIEGSDEAYENQRNAVLTHITAPFPYQLDGINYGLNNNKWLLLDQMGLGKTLQVIYMAEELKEQEGLEHCLVICGLSILRSNWKKEIKKHSKLDCRILGETISKKGRISYGSLNDRAEELEGNIKEFFIVTNIETFRSEKALKSLLNSSTNIGMIVVDEIHKCLEYNSLIDTDKGKLKIGDIVENNVNCKILSYNHKSRKLEYKEILNKYKLFNNENLLQIEIIDEANNIHILKCSPDHKIYTINRGYIKAKNLSLNDEFNIENILKPY